MSQFALVSTVDTMGDGFPCHCVMVFESEREAIQYAINCIIGVDPSVQYIAEEALWLVGDEHYESPADALEAWQDKLTPTEYFHVKPVMPTQSLVH